MRDHSVGGVSYKSAGEHKFQLAKVRSRVESKTAHAGGHLKRVLVVPDQIIADEIGATFFDRRSFGVRSAHDANEALGIASAWRPDLIVLRSDIPGGSARDFCLLVRAKLPRTKLLLVDEIIGHADSDGLDGLCDARLLPPVTAEQLLDTAAELLAVRTRRAPRFPVDTLVHLTGFGLATPQGAGEEGALANAMDINELGMLLEAGAQLDLGAEGQLAFFLPDIGERIVMKGVVRVALDEILLHYAIEFSGGDPACLHAIERYISRQAED